jgi:hypothetical protein
MNRKHLLAGFAALAVLAMALPAEAAPVEFTEGFSVSIDTAWSLAPAPTPLQALSAMPLAGPVASPAALVDPVAVQDASAEPVISQEDLADMAGQGDAPVAVLTEQALTALNSGNSVIGGTVGSGAISIDQNAFTGFDGIGNFVINSGHNNNLQSSLSVSIVITQ